MQGHATGVHGGVKGDSGNINILEVLDEENPIEP